MSHQLSLLPKFARHVEHRVWRTYHCQFARELATDATTLSPTNDGEELPHHALQDARIIASMRILGLRSFAISVAVQQ